MTSSASSNPVSASVSDMQLNIQTRIPSASTAQCTAGWNEVATSVQHGSLNRASPDLPALTLKPQETETSFQSASLLKPKTSSFGVDPKVSLKNQGEGTPNIPGGDTLPLYTVSVVLLWQVPLRMDNKSSRSLCSVLLIEKVLLFCTSPPTSLLASVTKDCNLGEPGSWAQSLMSSPLLEIATSTSLPLILTNPLAFVLALALMVFGTVKIHVLPARKICRDKLPTEKCRLLRDPAPSNLFATGDGRFEEGEGIEDEEDEEDEETADEVDVVADEDEPDEEGVEVEGRGEEEEEEEAAILATATPATEHIVPNASSISCRIDSCSFSHASVIGLSCQCSTFLFVWSLTDTISRTANSCAVSIMIWLLANTVLAASTLVGGLTNRTTSLSSHSK